MTIETRNPTTDQRIEAYEEMDHATLNAIIEEVAASQRQWRDKSIEDRSRVMKQAAQVLKDNKTEYAQIMAQEMGKPVTAGEAEIEKCAWCCEHYADYASEYLKGRDISTEMTQSYVTYQPLGVIFAIMPWNFPFWQVFRFAAPTLMAGNGAILKHAPISTGTALAIEEVLQQAGLPQNLFRSVIADNDGAQTIIEHQKVAAVTLTGSARAGKAVGAEAAQALKRIVLELGGSDPLIVLEDADLDQAADTALAARLKNSGQVCIAPKRIIIIDSVYDRFLEKIQQKIQNYRLGDPMDRHTTLGPMARKDLRDELHRQVKQSIDEGAQLIEGGEIPEGDGFYYPPTILTEVKRNTTAFDQELFGPVVCLVRAEDEQQAINMANETQYGLGGAVFTQDVAKGERIAKYDIESGVCAVNTSVASDPRLPFGGIKASGYGRELSAEGIRSFTNTKTIMVK